MNGPRTSGNGYSGFSLLAQQRDRPNAEGRTRRTDDASSKRDSEVLPPLATPISDRLLPDYRFRLLVVRKGSFFSILPVLAAAAHGRLCRPGV